jgi:hypothetical protein
MIGDLCAFRSPNLSLVERHYNKGQTPVSVGTQVEVPWHHQECEDNDPILVMGDLESRRHSRVKVVGKKGKFPPYASALLCIELMDSKVSFG